MLSQPQQRLVLMVGTAVMLVLLGAASMQTVLAWRLSRTRAFTLQPDVRPKVCTVTVEGVRDGRIEGVLAGSGRVFVGSVQALPSKDGRFSVDAKDFLVNRVTVTVPPGTQYVASRKGSKYYPLHSATGKKIAPQNRVYFKSRAEAEAAGFRP